MFCPRIRGRTRRERGLNCQPVQSLNKPLHHLGHRGPFVPGNSLHLGLGASDRPVVGPHDKTFNCPSHTFHRGDKFRFAIGVCGQNLVEPLQSGGSTVVLLDSGSEKLKFDIWSREQHWHEHVAGQVTCTDRLQKWKLAVMFSSARDCSRSLGKLRSRRLDMASEVQQIDTTTSFNLSCLISLTWHTVSLSTPKKWEFICYRFGRPLWSLTFNCKYGSSPMLRLKTITVGLVSSNTFTVYHQAVQPDAWTVSKLRSHASCFLFCSLAASLGGIRSRSYLAWRSVVGPRHLCRWASAGSSLPSWRSAAGSPGRFPRLESSHQHHWPAEPKHKVEHWVLKRP